MRPLLEVEDLHVTYRMGTGNECPALAGVSFELQAGETLGVLGESGSGKSTLAAALLRLLPPNGRIQKGAVRFDGQDLLQAQPQELQKIRGGRIGLIFQEPSMALHPAIRAGEQVSDVIAAHQSLSRPALQDKTLQILRRVFLGDPKRIAESYPHQLSGGQRQRVLIAQAIACDPDLVIADEPTASLDPSTQQEILKVFKSLRQQLNLSFIVISHNPAVLAGIADRVLVLYAGRVSEIGSAEKVLTSPQHPYTQALLQCLPPRIEEESLLRKTKLPVIPGESPNSSQSLQGCCFEPRCSERMEICKTSEPIQISQGQGQAVSCFKYGA